jgi:hypothetical protein
MSECDECDECDGGKFLFAKKHGIVSDNYKQEAA